MTPFSARSGGTVNIEVAGTSANVLLERNPGVRQVRVMNDGTATVWIDFGKASTLAVTTATGVPIGAGVTEVYTTKIADGPLYVAAIAAGASGKIYFTPGSGV